jgi:YidC/Oxa1 family membrane protein insertase
MEERRLLIAVALSLLALALYQMWFAPPPRPTPSPAVASSAAPATPAPSLAPTPAPPAAAKPPAGGASPRPGAAPTPAPVMRIADERDRRVEVIGQDVTVAFATRGARLLSWELHNFRDARGRAEELVPAIREGLRPLDLETGQADIDARLQDALFRPSLPELRLGTSGGEITFEFADGDLRAVKALRFPARGYLAEVRAAVEKAGQPLPVRVLWGPGVGNASPEEREVQGYQPPQAVFRSGQGVERVPADKLSGPRVLSGVTWAGVESTHFAALWVPPGGTAEVRAVPQPSADGKAHFAPVAAAVLPGGPATAQLYVGPKDYQTLARLDHGLKDVVPVGEWIGPIVVPLMGLLRWAYRVMGNYGWAIVLLTVLINLAMAPLRHFSIANGLKMAKMAPEMRVIQERYRKVPLMDPRRQDMQVEIGELYARHGMNMSTQMLVGCLPLLLTMPFLIAFYRVLQVSVELRGAHFIWIADLSRRDPYFITPVLMGLSMFFMQKMMPSAMDPAQQKIMMIMPAALSVMFLWAPAGLNLYWLASNLCSILQQAITLRILGEHGGAKGKAEGDKRERKRA